MTIEEIEIRRILNQMLADNGINRETIKDIIKECIDERVEKALRNLINQSDGSFDSLPIKIQAAIDRLVYQSVERETRMAISDKVRSIFSKIVVNVELNNVKKTEVTENE